MSKAQQRFITYYLEQGKNRQGDWEWFQESWDQIQRCWDWVQADTQSTLFYIFTFFEFQQRVGLWRDAIVWQTVGTKYSLQSHDPHWATALLQLNLGLSHAALGEIETAISHYQFVLGSSQDWRNIYTALINLSNLHRRQGKPQMAETLCNQALSLAEKGQNTRHQAEAYGMLGSIYDDISDYPAARQAYQTQMGLIESEEEESADCWLHLGVVEQHAGNLPQAEKLFTSALAIFKKTGNIRKLAATRGNLALVYLETDRLKQADAYLIEVRHLYEKIGDRANLGSSLSNLGIAYVQRGNHTDAIRLFEQSLELSRAVGERPAEGIDLGNLGNAYLAIGQLGKARDYLVDALDIAEDTGDKRQQARCFGALGATFEAAGMIHEAVDCCERAFQLAKSIGDRQTVETVVWNLSALYEGQGEPERAVALRTTWVDWLQSAENQTT